MENKLNNNNKLLNYSSALIGYSGVVGSSILNSDSPSLFFNDLYNSSNIDTISSSKVYDLVVCSAPSANKFLANKYPEQALSSLDALKTGISKITLRSGSGIFVLISSFDAIISPNSTYGAIRKELEDYVLSVFGNQCVVLRLPSLVGSGVNKGFGRDLFTPYPLYLPKETYQELQAVLSDEVLSAYYMYDMQSELYKFTGIIEDEDTSTNSTLRLALQERRISPLNFYHSDSRFVLFSLDYLGHLLERIFMVTLEYGIPALRFVLGKIHGTSDEPLILNLANSSTNPTVGEYARVIGLYPKSSYQLGSSGYVFGDNKGIPKIDYALSTLPLTTISSCLLSLELA